MNSAFYQIISATTVMHKSLILVLYMLQLQLPIGTLDIAQDLREPPSLFPKLVSQ